MDHTVCPGAKILRQPRPEMFDCPQCGEEVEIWSDEIRGTCGACGKAVFREGLPSCVEWCKYGKECVGEEAFGTYQRNRALGLKRRLLEVLKRQGLVDEREASRRERAVSWAEAILEHEPGMWHLVIPAVLVHDVASREPSAQNGLEKLLLAQGLDAEDVRAVRSIAAEAGRPGTLPAELNARIARDAWTLEELAENESQSGAQARWCTATAAELAQETVTPGAGADGPTAGKAARAAGTATHPGMMEEHNA